MKKRIHFSKEKKKLAWQIQQKLHDEAIFIPAYKTKYLEILHSPWVKWPNNEDTQFAPRSIYDPYSTYVWWIDEKQKAELGKKFQNGEKLPVPSSTFDINEDAYAFPMPSRH